MPKLPVIQQFAKTPDNDFMIFQWCWNDQINLTIQAKNIRNPLKWQTRKGVYLHWPSYNGAPLSPGTLAAAIKALEAQNISINTIEILTKDSGTRSTLSESYINILNRELDYKYNVIGYRDANRNFPDSLVNALNQAPASVTDPDILTRLSETPGFGTFSAQDVVSISRMNRDMPVTGQSVTYSPVQPYHVRAGKRPYRSANVAGSLPKPAAANSDRVGGERPTTGGMAADAMEAPGLFGL